MTETIDRVLGPWLVWKKPDAFVFTREEWNGCEGLSENLVGCLCPSWSRTDGLQCLLVFSARDEMRCLRFREAPP